jgi:hypothetical protein
MPRFRAHSSIARFVLFAGLLLGRAAQAEEVVKTYQDAEAIAPVAKILVIGVHDDFGTRGQFENAFARALRSVGAGAEPSLYSVGGVDDLTAAKVVAAARKAGADAVMVTRVVDVETENPDAAKTVTEYFQAYSKYGDPLPISTTYTVRVRSDLYLVENQARIWAVESTEFEKPDLFTVIEGIAQALTVQLRKDGLIDAK